MFVNGKPSGGRQEQELGDLEILKQKLGLAAQYHLTPQQVHVLAVTVVEPQQDLKALVYEGRLTLSGEEPRPIEHAPVARRRRRKSPPPEGALLALLVGARLTAAFSPARAAEDCKPRETKMAGGTDRISMQTMTLRSRD